MKVMLLSDIDSMHTVNWANGLVQKGVEVHLCGFYLNSDSLKAYLPEVKLYAAKRKAGVRSKADFLSVAPWVKKIVGRVQPDILHAHYATSYGLVARRVDHPISVVSVWGSDIYAFPNNSSFSRNVLSSNLDHAKMVFSTSKDMATRTREFTKTKVHVVPFGVDIEAFKPVESAVEGLRIGTVKTLESTYGIDFLIQTFALINKELPDVELHIVGEGSQQTMLEGLAEDLGVAARVTFHGSLPNTQVPAFLASLDVFFVLSRAESFGVSVVEAAACGLPSIVSDVGGLPETVVDGKTGYITNTDDLDGIANKAINLLKDEGLRKELGRNAVQFVKEQYSREACVNLMISHYRALVG